MRGEAYISGVGQSEVGVRLTRHPLLLTVDAVRQALVSLADKAEPADSVAVFLIGHGSFDGERYKFNLPGPDMDDEELAELLAALPARSQLIVNATSASGAVLERWAADGRILITATKSGWERNATRFAEHWAAALSSDEADANKNSIVTVAEAFEFAERRVAMRRPLSARVPR